MDDYEKLIMDSRRRNRRANALRTVLGAVGLLVFWLALAAASVVGPVWLGVVTLQWMGVL